MNRQASAAKGLVGGIVAGTLASAAMDLYWGAVGRMLGDRPEQKPRPSDPKPSKPSTQVVADAIAKAVTGHEVPREQKAAAGIAAHYAMGAISGGIYGIAAARRPRWGIVAGIVFGLLIWVLVDEAALRALEAAPDAESVPASQHLKAAGAHVVYGASTGLLTRLLR